MSTVIKVENLSKQYRLGDVGTGTLRDDFKRWRYRLMGKEDPFLKIGEENDRRKVSESDYVWALKDINFEVEQGDVVGIIGRNGAGKSTLLKILSRTTAPTTGSVKVKGRIASLLEVGTGFHGELSGRENIYLNGAIMGLRKWEIDKKLDEIIDFAGVDRYLDTPVKRYSSGMYVRLAFAVAAHLEPDILIVDEVLAVGDAEFQKKCLGKMKDVSKGQGRTVLFVSHNMIAVEWLYNNAILLSNGTIAMNSKSNEVLNYYTKNNNTILTTEFNGEYFNYSQDKIRIINAKVNKNTTLNSFLITESFNITIEINVLKQVTLNTTFIIFSSDDQHVCSTSSINKNGTIHSFTPGIHQIVCNVPSDFFNCGIYKFTLIIVENYTTVLIVIENIFILDFKENIETRGHYLGPWNGFVRPKWSWNLSKN